MTNPTSKSNKTIQFNPAALLKGGAILLGLFILWLLYSIRSFGFFRGIFMLFYRHPGLFTIAWLFALGGMAIHMATKVLLGQGYYLPARKTSDANGGRGLPRRRSSSYYGREPEWIEQFIGLGITWLITGFLGFLVAAIFMGAWTDESLIHSVHFNKITPAMMEGSIVRIKPYDVATNQLDSSFNSSTDSAENVGIVKYNGKQYWTAVQDPESLGRRLSGDAANGLIAVGAQTSTPDVKNGEKAFNGNFKYSTSALFSSNLGWQIHDRCYTCDVTEVVGIPTSSGPILAAPYVVWTGGIFVTHPVFGGVFIENTKGKITQLNAKQAENDPTLVASGRVFPDGLARKIATSYQYSGGIWNKLFSHSGQFVVADTEEDNLQPFYEDLKKLGPSWITTMEPHGRTFTTAAVLVTSAITGKTYIWKTPDDSSYIGNDRALTIVQGQSGLGISWTGFQTLEPREIFPPGQGLEFLVTIAPDASTRITENVVVNAQSQSVVAVFQANGQGDQDLVNYLNSGKLPPKEQFDGAGSGNGTGLTSTPEQNSGTTPTATTPAATGTTITNVPTGGKAVAIIEAMIQQNEQEQAQDQTDLTSLEAQLSDLQKLLKAAQK